MDTMDIQTATVVGTARTDAWSQVQSFITPGGRAVVMVSLRYTGESDLVDLASIGSSLLAQIHATLHYTADVDGHSSEGIETSVLIVHFHNGSVTIEGVGDVELYIFRNGKMGRLFAGSSTLTTIDGICQPRDVLLAVTSSTTRLLGLSTIRQFMGAGFAAAEDLAVSVHGTSNSSQMAAALLSVSLDSPRDTPAPVAPSPQLFASLRRFVGNIALHYASPKPLFIAPEKRTKNLWIGSVLLALLFIGIVVGALRRSTLIRQQAYLSLDHSITQKISEARSIGDLNPERAKVLLQQSGDEIDIYLEKTDDKNYQDKARLLAETLTVAETEIFKKEQIALTTLAEMSVIKKDLTPAAFAIDENGVIYLADARSPRIVGISVSDKSILEYSTDSVGVVGEMGVYKKTLYALVREGVARVTSSAHSLAISPDDLWKDVQMLDVFAGNVYLLDKGQSEIWKYPALTDGFGSRKRWLAPGIAPDLTNVIDMKVDGDVWLITTSGKLVRYSRGVPVPFSMEGLPSDGVTLRDPRAVFATGEKVYLLERGEKRVVVFDEESGKYERQYSSDDFEKARDMVVHEDKVYLLFDDKIAWFGM